MHRSLKVVVGVLAMSALAGGAHAQVRTEAASVATLEQIVSELRALRAEMNQAAQAGLRAQLLVARLALQEQRISVVARELTETQEKLEAQERSRPMAELLKNMGTDPEAAKSGHTPPPNPFLDAIRGQAEALDKSTEELENRHAELSRALADEQSRWTAFNAQLEMLERTLLSR